MKRINVLIKSIVIVFSALLFTIFSGCSSSEGQSSFQDNSQNGYNIQDLNGYGEWVSINDYGNVWHPYAINSWMPFDNGHWTFSNSNWTWISYEPFGWIVYHYGEWYDDPFYGWVWIPTDDIWSPANVIWLNYGDYVCWAPLGPRGVRYGNPWEKNQNRFWHVVKASDFTRDNIRDYRISNPIRNENEREIINRQPDRQFVEKNIGRTVQEVNVQREPVKLPERSIERMNLPKEENKRVEQNLPRVRKEVLMPRDEFHRQQNARNQNSGRKK